MADNIGVALPHKSIDADEYKGYYIPPGTTIIPNAWYDYFCKIRHFSPFNRAVLHDPVVYPDPSAFNPDRFLSTPGKTRPPHPGNYSFGFGRRLAIAKAFVIADILSEFARVALWR